MEILPSTVSCCGFGIALALPLHVFSLNEVFSGSPTNVLSFSLHSKEEEDEGEGGGYDESRIYLSLKDSFDRI
ncbi:hypothetical protein Y032_0003g1568 [Ancylostoma ceylanicum]|uniref:Uncharacterized protein n=1 Tax=Ancylostoma ceylanicum TaxID=53326 RepID=A0A016VYM3_9BILA|nr:hypothetical protein Y032_0003g1568 [Ancylostoma ceylanicum]